MSQQHHTQRDESLAQQDIVQDVLHQFVDTVHGVDIRPEGKTG